MTSIADSLEDRMVLQEDLKLERYLSRLPPDGKKNHKRGNIRQKLLSITKEDGDLGEYPANFSFKNCKAESPSLYAQITGYIIDAWLDFDYKI